MKPQVRKVVHLLPVGFERDRVVGPLIKDRLPGDKIILLKGGERGGEETHHAATSDRMASLVRRDLETFARFDSDVIEEIELENVHNYEDAFSHAYTLLWTKLHEGSDVWVNISSMPRTVSFAFAAAADAITLKDPTARNRITIYYAAPEEYLISTTTRNIHRLVERMTVQMHETTNPEVIAVLGSLSNELKGSLYDLSEYGLSKGLKKMPDGSHHVVIQSIPSGAPSRFETDILVALASLGGSSNLSNLTRIMGQRARAPDVDDWVRRHKSKVAYNLKGLEMKGFVVLESGKNQPPVRLTNSGSMWIHSHAVPLTSIVDESPNF